MAPAGPSPSTTSPQHSQLSYSQPNTPQSLATPRSHRFGFLDHSKKCAAIYKDSPSEKSFVTAVSGETEPDPGVITKHDIPSAAEFVIYPEDQAKAERVSERVAKREWDVQARPSSSKVGELRPEQPRTGRETELRQSRRFSESEVTFNATPDPERRPTTVPAPLQKPRGTGRMSFMSIGSTTIRNESVTGDDGVAEGDQFIMERWMKTLFYSASGGKELLSVAKGQRKQSATSSACVLFWVGFVAPWCWLVGGWMSPSDVPLRENEVKGKTLKEKVSADADREMVSQGQEGGGLKKWLLPDPSSNFKATARAPSTSCTTTRCPKEVEGARVAAIDPWIRRCRIASIVGGAILGLGLVVMVVVLGMARG